MAQNLRNLSKLSILSPFRRSVSTTVPKCKDKVVCEAPSASATAAASSEDIGQHFVHPTDFQKRVLVFTKRYSSYDEIPEKVPTDKINRSKDIFRIKVATWSMVFTVIGAMFMIISGKNAAQRGESVEQRGMDWHYAYEEKHANDKAK